MVVSYPTCKAASLGIQPSAQQKSFVFVLFAGIVFDQFNVTIEKGDNHETWTAKLVESKNDRNTVMYIITGTPTTRPETY